MDWLLVSTERKRWPIAEIGRRRSLSGEGTALRKVFLAGLLVLPIASVTVAGHAIRVARTSPIHARQYE